MEKLFFSVSLAPSSVGNIYDTACLCTAGLPSCLLCVCVSGSVYCDDSELTQIPPLPKDTTHFYARFNKITEVKAKDFINLSKPFLLKTQIYIKAIQNL